MTADIIRLLPQTSPPAVDLKEIAEWMRLQADLIEEGEFPALERVFMVWYEPDAEEGEPTFSMNSHGTRSINRAEGIGLLEIALHKQKAMIR
jgi:hypothetical protein